MAKYKVQYTLKRSKKTIEHDGTSVDVELLRRSKVVVLLRDSEGEDHPANAGKFFLDRILK